MTGLVLVSGILRKPANMGLLKGVELTTAVFAQLPVVGTIVLSVGLLSPLFFPPFLAGLITENAPVNIFSVKRSFSHIV